MLSRYEKSPRQPLPFVLAREIPLLDEGPERADRHFSGAVGGAATEPRSGAGTALPGGVRPREQSLCRMLHGCTVPSTASARGGDRRAGELENV